MNDMPPGALAARLVGSLHSVEDRFEAALEPLGLSIAKFGVLSKLVAAGEPLPLGTLAERLACVRSNMTQLVDRLEADKLVRRVSDPGDRRSIHAELTREGRSLHAAALKKVAETEREIFSSLASEQRVMLLEVLDALQAAPAR